MTYFEDLSKPPKLRDIYERLYKSMNSDGRREAKTYYGIQKDRDLRGKWEGYHLLEFVNYIRKSDGEEDLETLLVKFGQGSLKSIQDLPTGNSAYSTRTEKAKNLLKVISKYMNISFDQCIILFLDFCCENRLPVRSIGFEKDFESFEKFIADLDLDIQDKFNVESALPEHKRKVVIPPSPYKGLKNFEPEDSHIFCGRDEEIEKLADDVKKKAFTAVLGASGCGKSSLVLAGLIPRLCKEDYFAIHFRPCDTDSGTVKDVFYPLARKLNSYSKFVNQSSVADTKATIRNDEDGLINCINDAREGELAKQDHPSKKKKLLVVIDQLEELITRLGDENIKKEFLDIIYNAQGNAGDNPAFSIVVTLRYDFFEAFNFHNEFFNLIADNSHPIKFPDRAQYEAIIKSPIEKMGYKVRYEEELISDLCNDSTKYKNSLPLLQYTLDELWGKQSKGVIQLKSYRAQGDIAENLTRKANSYINSLSTSDQRSAKIAMVKLVGSEKGVGVYTRRLAIKNKDLSSSEWNLIQFLSGKEYRLTVIYELEDFSDFSSHNLAIEFAHDILVYSWKELHQWMDEYSDFNRWLEKTKFRYADNSLLSGIDLKISEVKCSEFCFNVPKSIASFVEKSREESDLAEKKQIKRKKNLFFFTSIFFSFFAFVVIVGVALLIMSNVRLQKKHNSFLALKSQDFEEQGFYQLAAVSALQSLEGFNAGVEYPLGYQKVALSVLDKLHGRELKIAKHLLPKGVTSIKFLSDNESLVMGYKTGEISLHDIQTGKKKKLVAIASGSISQLAVSPSNKSVVVILSGGKSEEYDIESGNLLSDSYVLKEGSQVSMKRNNIYDNNAHGWFKVNFLENENPSISQVGGSGSGFYYAKYRRIDNLNYFGRQNDGEVSCNPYLKGNNNKHGVLYCIPSEYTDSLYMYVSGYDESRSIIVSEIIGFVGGKYFLPSDREMHLGQSKSISGDLKIIARQSGDFQVFINDIENPRRDPSYIIVDENYGKISSIFLSKSGRKIVLSQLGGMVSVIDLDNDSKPIKLKVKDNLYLASLSDTENKLLLCNVEGENSILSEFNLKTKEQSVINGFENIFSQYSKYSNSFSSALDQSESLAFSYNYELNYEAKLIRLRPYFCMKSLQPFHKYRVDEFEIEDVYFSFLRKGLEFYRSTCGNEACKVRVNASVKKARISSDKKYVLAYGGQSVVLIDVLNAKLKHKLSYPESLGILNVEAYFSSVGDKFAVVIDNKIIEVYGADDFNLLYRQEFTNSEVSFLRFSDDSKNISWVERFYDDRDEILEMERVVVSPISSKSSVSSLDFFRSLKLPPLDRADVEKSYLETLFD